jgi:predicted aspartyl protease
MSVSLPFRYASPEVPLVLVPATINGRGPYHLLIDTGNGETEPFLFRPLASTLGLPLDEEPDEEGDEAGVVAAVRLARTRLDRLDVGRIQRRSLDALVMDPLPLPPVTVVPEGILGYGFFRDYRLVIDYPAQVLEFIASHGANGSPGGAAFELGSPKPFIILDVAVNDGPGRPFLFDTGASHTTISPALAGELGLTLQPGEAIAVSGTLEAGAARVGRLAAAGMTEDDAEVAVIDLFGPVSEAAGRPIEGVLGYPFFRSCRLEIDYPTRRLLLTPAAATRS